MNNPNSYNEQVIAEFRANGGRVGGHHANRSLLLLHTTGARSGLPRIHPLVTMPDGDRLVVIASKGGAPSHPDWYHNVVANPAVTVEVGSEQFAAEATVAAEPERSQLFARMAERYPFFAEYARQVSRVIPVVILTRRGAA